MKDDDIKEIIDGLYNSQRFKKMIRKCISDCFLNEPYIRNSFMEKIMNVVLTEEKYFKKSLYSVIKGSQIGRLLLWVESNKLIDEVQELSKSNYEIRKNIKELENRLLKDRWK